MCYIGLALPLSAQSQDVWSIPPGGAAGLGAPGSWGGHAVPVVGYDERGLVCVTWGQLKRMTYQFWSAYCDEAYTLLSKDFVEEKGATPDGVNWAQLLADMQSLKTGYSNAQLIKHCYKQRQQQAQEEKWRTSNPGLFVAERDRERLHDRGR